MFNVINAIKTGFDSIFDSYATGNGRLFAMTIEDISDEKEPKLLSSAKAHTLAKTIFYYYSEPMIANYPIKNDENVETDLNISDAIKYFKVMRDICPLFYFDPKYFTGLSDPFIANLSEKLQIFVNKWKDHFDLQLVTTNQTRILIQQARMIMESHLNVCLRQCIASNQFPLAEHWIEEGADVNMLLLDLIGSHRPNFLQIAEYLLNKGADLNFSDYYNRKPLLLAAEKADLPALQFLVQHGANVNNRNLDGKTAIQVALSTPPTFFDDNVFRWKIVLSLLQSGASYQYNDILRLLVLAPAAGSVWLTEPILVDNPRIPKSIKFLVGLTAFLTEATSRVTYHLLFDPGIKRIFNALFTGIKRHLVRN